MRNLPFFSCLLESYGYNFIHLRSSALCCGCHRAFGSGQIKRTCSPHPQPSSLPSLRTDPEVLVVFLIGQGRKRQLAINQLIASIHQPPPPTPTYFPFKVIQAPPETLARCLCFLFPTETFFCPLSRPSGLAVKQSGCINPVTAENRLRRQRTFFYLLWGPSEHE